MLVAPATDNQPYRALSPAEPGTPLYTLMKSGFDYTPVLRTAVEDCGVDSQEDAVDLLEAFLQWASVAPARERDTTYVMLKSDVDRLFHAFVLNTRKYREFCECYFGHFMDHTPVEGEVSRKSVEYTVSLLEEYYGDDLHPALQQWRQLTNEDAWRVSCGW